MRLLAFLAVGLLSACQCRSPCAPENCAGCCDSAGACVAGIEPLACGARANDCRVCVSDQRCEGGRCIPASSTGEDGGNPVVDAGLDDAGGPGVNGLRLLTLGEDNLAVGLYRLIPATGDLGFVGPVPVGKISGASAIDRARGLLYFVGSDSTLDWPQYLFVLSAQTGVVLRKSALAATVWRMCLRGDGQLVALTSVPHVDGLSLDTVNPTSGELTPIAQVPGGSWNNFVCDARNDRLYMVEDPMGALSGPYFLLTIDLVRGAVLNRVQLALTLPPSMTWSWGGLFLRSDGSVVGLHFRAAEGVLDRLDPATGAVTSLTTVGEVLGPVGNSGGGLALGGDERIDRAYVVSPPPQQVFTVDLVTGQVLSARATPATVKLNNGLWPP